MSESLAFQSDIILEDTGVNYPNSIQNLGGELIKDECIVDTLAS